MEIEYTCPLEITHNLMRSKWKPVIIWQIHCHSRVGLAQLERDIKGLSQKMLLQDLKQLQEYGIVSKKEFSGYPRKVEYYITDDLGYEFVSIIEKMQSLGTKLINNQYPLKSR